MDKKLQEQYELDELAEQVGGYFMRPTAKNMAYADLFFDVCQQFDICCYSATDKGRAFVEEVTQVTWEKQQERKTGVRRKIRPSFSVPPTY